MVIADEKSVSPAQIEARVLAQSSLHRTPCGEGTMAWRRWGHGEPLVLVHGGTGSWRHWIRNIEHFSQTRTIWAPDLPGLGDSALPPEGALMEDYVGFTYAGLVSLLGAGESVDIAGFSFGGLNAGLLAERLGERARRLVVVGSAGLAQSNTPRERMIVWRKVQDPVEFEAALRNNLETLMFADPANIDPLAVYLMVQNANRARLRRPPLGGYLAFRDALPNIKARIHAIWGSRDSAALPNIEERRSIVREGHPGARTSIIEGAGHWAMYENAPAFNAMLEETLAS